MNRKDLPMDKFCEIYNDVPKILEAYAAVVNLNADTYRKSIDQIIYEEANNDNYWIITSNDKDSSTWLVPNPLRKVMPTLGSLPFAFNINKQKQQKQVSDFTLFPPALVVALPTEPITWKLIEQGVISFEDLPL